MTARTFGFLGLGAMGSRFAQRAAEHGYDVRGYDVDQSVCAEVAAAGVRTATLAELARVDVLCCSLPNDRVLEAALSGENGLCKELRSGATLIDFSTVLPDTIRRIADFASGFGIETIDAPVSGGPNEVAAGKLTVLAGCTPGALDAFTEFLTIYGTVRAVGAVGDAKVVKICNNMMTMGNVLVAAEAFALGVKGGIAPEKLYEVLSQSGGTSQHFVKRFPYVLARDFHARFALDLGKKDLDLALTLARSQGNALVATSLIREMYGIASLQGFGGDDIVAVAKLYEQWAAIDTETP